MEKQITLYRLDRFTRGVLVLIAVFLGILVFKPLLRTEKVYVTNLPWRQQVYGTVDIHQGNSSRNPVYVEVVGDVDLGWPITINDRPSIRVQVTNWPHESSYGG